MLFLDTNKFIMLFGRINSLFYQCILYIYMYMIQYTKENSDKCFWCLYLYFVSAKLNLYRIWISFIPSTCFTYRHTLLKYASQYIVIHNVREKRTKKQMKTEQHRIACKHKRFCYVFWKSKSCCVGETTENKGSSDDRTKEDNR